jgi:stress-induced-phosphoprotein 1
MIDVLGALMGIDLQASTRPEGSTEVPEGFDIPSQSPPSSPPPRSTPSKPAQPTPPPPAEDVEMEDDDEEAQVKKTAEAAKEAGSLAYKNRDFDEAIKQFDLAWDTWPKNLTYLTNSGGMRSFY